MISPESQYGKEYRSAEISESYYDLMQRLAYKFGTSTRVVSTIIMNAGLHKIKDMNQMNKLIHLYRWYQFNRVTGTNNMNDKDREKLEKLIKYFEI